MRPVGLAEVHTGLRFLTDGSSGLRARLTGEFSAYLVGFSTPLWGCLRAQSQWPKRESCQISGINIAYVFMRTCSKLFV